MTKSKVSLIAAVAFLAISPATIFADETMDLLMAGPWKIVGISWSATRTFYENGTFTTQDNAREHGSWQIRNGVIELVFAGGHTDTFTLPLNAKGTVGADSHKYPFVAYLQGPAPTPEPNAGKNGGVAAATPSPVPANFSVDDSINILTAGPWKIWGNGWAAQRTFRKNGTFFSDGGERGKWQINGAVIELLFDDGHKDTLSLPIKAPATAGTSSDGLTMVGYLTNYDDVKGMLPGAAQPQAAVANSSPATGTPPKTAGGPVKSPTPAPAVAANTAPGHAPAASATPVFVPSKPLPFDTAGLLAAGPWKIKGMTFDVEECTFDKNGTLTVNSLGNMRGTWRIEGNVVVVNFVSEPIILSLPLNPRGTLASRGDRGGIAILKNARDYAAPAFSLPRAGAVPDVPEQTTTALLTAGQWRFWGVDWMVDRKFNADGTFTSQSRIHHTGTWKIIGGSVELTYDDGQKDTLLLPLDPKGELGACSDGFAMMGFLGAVPPQLASSLPTKHPWPTPPPSVARANPPPQPANAGGESGGGFFPRVIAAIQGAMPEPRPSPISAEMQQKAADLVKNYNASLVFVNGKEGAGSGFIASLGGRNFLVTNAHVAAGIRDATFKDVDDTTVKGGAAYVAVGRDLYTMALPAGGKPLEVMDKVGENAAIGDEVVVLGNAEGQGVINLITGRITGIGGDRIEVDAPFVPGNSGSPIIHIKSGKVIGVATYAFIKDYDATTQTPTFRPVIRRFGYRLDNVKQWETVDPRTFGAQAVEMEGIEGLTEDLFAICDAFSEGFGRVDPEEFTSPTVKNCVAQWAKATEGRHTEEERKHAAADLFSALRNAAQVDVTAARSHMTYDYFKGELAKEQEYRDAFVKVFDAAVKEAGN